MQPSTFIMHQKLLRKIRITLIFFIIALAISGITAFAVETELKWLTSHMSWLPQQIQDFIQHISNSITQVNTTFPQMAYGFDWLAFAHLIIALLFIGPLRDPIKNIWVIEWGMMACVAIIPLAFICGEIRGIPIYWRLIDCSFGVFGIIPLWMVHRWTKKLTIEN